MWEHEEMLFTDWLQLLKHKLTSFFVRSTKLPKIILLYFCFDFYIRNLLTTCNMTKYWTYYKMTALCWLCVIALIFSSQLLVQSVSIRAKWPTPLQKTFRTWIYSYFNISSKNIKTKKQLYFQNDKCKRHYNGLIYQLPLYLAYHNQY